MNVDDVITGVVVSYNTRDLLRSAVESVRRFHPNMKLVIVDGSREDNPCYGYVQHLADAKTRVFHSSKNIGHGRGLDYGIRQAQTPYVLIFDSDIIMLQTPLEDMLAMMVDDTFGVGYKEPADLGGHEWGSRKHMMKEGPMKYLHPYFCLIQKKEYFKYPPYCHHGAPAVNIMLNIHRKGLSDIVLKEFPGLGHTSGKGWTWEGKPRIFVKHDTRGTRRVVPGEIEGKWDTVVDPGPQKIEPRIKIVDPKPDPKPDLPREIGKVTCITCTGDRLVSLSLLEKWMEQQTIQPYQWIVVDDGRTPHQPKMDCDYIRRTPRNTDPKQTLNINMEVALRNVEGDIILFCEDDEYYSPEYVEAFVKRFSERSKTLAVGICRSKYYHLPSRTYHVHPNRDHASLAQTGIHKDFIGEVQSILGGSPFIDVRLWERVRDPEERGHCNKVPFPSSGIILGGGRGYLFDDGLVNCLYVGMKGMPGRQGIGSGHKGIGRVDENFKMLKNWIARTEDFQLYEEVYSCLEHKTPIGRIAQKQKKPSRFLQASKRRVANMR